MLFSVVTIKLRIFSAEQKRQLYGSYTEDGTSEPHSDTAAHAVVTPLSHTRCHLVSALWDTNPGSVLYGLV